METQASCLPGSQTQSLPLTSPLEAGKQKQVQKIWITAIYQAMLWLYCVASMQSACEV